MSQPAVNNVSALHPTVDGGEAGGHFRDHARLQLRQHGTQLVGGERGDQRGFVGPVGVQPLDVGEDHQFGGIQRLGEGCRCGVGVDVEHLVGAVAVVVNLRGHRGDHGDPPRLEDVEDGGGVHADHLADQAEVHLDAVDDGAGAGGLQEAAVLAGESDGVRAVRVDETDQFASHLAGEHHPDHLHGFGGGDPQSALEFGLDAKPLQH